MTTRLVIIGATGANLASLQFALERLDVRSSVSNDPAVIRAAERVILPGVGAAADAMRRLHEHGLDAVIPTLQQPVLGICLGMQLLFAHSEEDDSPCLGIIPETVRRLPASAGLPIPHMGWNALEDLAAHPLMTGLGSNAYAYFVHSYAVAPHAGTIASTEYGCRFSAAVAHDNFMGTQFHPERSAAVGAAVLRNFLAI